MHKLGGALGVQKAELSDPLIQRPPRRLPMQSMYYIGLDELRSAKQSSRVSRFTSDYPPHQVSVTQMPKGHLGASVGFEPLAAWMDRPAMIDEGPGVVVQIECPSTTLRVADHSPENDANGFL